MLIGRRQTFRAASPVGVYWLSRAVGFEVEDTEGTTATIEEVAFRDPLGPPAFLVVRIGGLFTSRRRAISVAEVHEVDPWQSRVRLRGSLGAAIRRTRRVAGARQAALD